MTLNLSSMKKAPRAPEAGSRVGEIRAAQSLKITAEELIVVLVEGVDANLQIVPRQSGAEGDLAARVTGRAMVGGGYREVVGVGVVVGAVVVIEG